MTQSREEEISDGMRVTAREWVFFVAVVLVWGVIAVTLGKDSGWDFRNYHWYNAYAFLNGRMGFDVAVAHHATYYNPLPDLPFYLIAQFSSAAAIFVLGAVQALNVIPLYLIARASLAPEFQLWSEPLALICMTGSTAMGLLGGTSNDTVMGILSLLGLAILVASRTRIAEGRLGAVVLAGSVIGAAVGLKLTQAPYALGYAAALMIIPGSARIRGRRLALGAGACLLGVIAVSGFWFAFLWWKTGNPLFPYFNEVFHSPLLLEASYRDTRFLPDSLWHALSYPFRFSFNYAIADDMPFQNFRVLAAYVLVPLAAVLWALRAKASDPLVAPEAARILFAFAGASYAAWIAMFAIYRYIVPLEMLAPLLILAAIGLLPLGGTIRFGVVAIILAATALFARYVSVTHADRGDPFVQVQHPPIPHPERSMILMTGLEPMGFIVPSLPPQIPVLRIDGFLAGPDDGSGLTAGMRARVRAHNGDFYLLAAPSEWRRAEAAVAAYGLATSRPECGNVATNLGGPYLLCPLKRHD